MKKRYLIPLAGLSLLAIAFLAGPTPDYPSFTSQIEPLKMSLAETEAFVSQKHVGVKNFKPGNESYIVWADSTKQKTEYSVVYLHGFSASPMEGNPIHKEFAQRYGANLYVPCLAKHGILDKESFKDLTPKDLIDSAKEAIAIGNILGKKLIVLSCSTGGTLSTYLAAENPELIYAQMTYSPNVDMAAKTSEILTLPWGLSLAQSVSGSKYRHVPIPETCAPYWTMDYRIEGLVALKSLIEETMISETFQKIKQPLFIGYYYENEENRDKTVSIPAMKTLFEEVKTPHDKKIIHAFPNGAHVMLSPLQNANIEPVRVQTFKFAEEVLGLKKGEKKE